VWDSACQTALSKAFPSNGPKCILTQQTGCWAASAPHSCMVLSRHRAGTQTHPGDGNLPQTPSARSRDRAHQNQEPPPSWSLRSHYTLLTQRKSPYRQGTSHLSNWETCPKSQDFQVHVRWTSCLALKEWNYKVCFYPKVIKSEISSRKIPRNPLDTWKWNTVFLKKHSSKKKL
jgi:hypothetical protein